MCALVLWLDRKGPKHATRRHSLRVVAARKTLRIASLCNVVHLAPAVLRRSVDGRQASDEKAQDETQNVASRRPRRATAVAAALRIQGKLERAGIVHDRKAYMQTLSSAVTIAQTKGQQQSSKRTKCLKRHAHGYLEETSDAETANQPQKDTNAHEAEGAHETVGMYTTSVLHPHRPEVNCSIHAATSVGAQATTTGGRQTNAPSPGHRPQGVKKTICPGYGRQYSNVSTLSNPPPQPGAKLIPARMRPPTAMASPEHGDSHLPAVKRSDWTDIEVKRLLHICTRIVRPDTPTFWVKVAKRMPGQIRGHFSSCRTLRSSVWCPSSSQQFLCLCLHAWLYVVLEELQTGGTDALDDTGALVSHHVCLWTGMLTCMHLSQSSEPVSLHHFRINATQVGQSINVLRSISRRRRHRHIPNVHHKHMQWTPSQ